MFFLGLKLKVFSFLVKIFLAAAIVDHEYFILFFAQAYKEVVGFDIVVDETFGMDPLYPFEDLISDEKNGLKCESSFAIP